MRDTTLKINQLNKTYGTQHVLKDIQMEIKKGSIYGFIGRNGAGKTTLMNIIVNMIQNYEGKIMFYTLNNQKRIIGSLIEYPSFYPNLSGFENLKYFSEFSGGYDKNEMNIIISLLKIENFIHKKVKNYSLGMKQRLGIAQTLFNSPEFLILDEPTNGLDPEGVIEIREIIKEVVEKQHLSVLISSHILSEIQLMCDRVLFLQNGRLIETVDLKKQLLNEKRQYKIETKSPNELAQFFKKLAISDVKIEGQGVIFNVCHDDIEVLIVKIIMNDYRFSAIYPHQKNLEMHFLDLLGGNQID